MSDDTEATVAAADDAAMVAARERLDRMSRKERRELGLTVRSVWQACRQLKAEDAFQRGDRHGNAALVLGQLVEENKPAYRKCRGTFGDDDDGERDWAAFFEALIAFLEKLIPLFMAFA